MVRRNARSLATAINPALGTPQESPALQRWESPICPKSGKCGYLRSASTLFSLENPPPNPYAGRMHLIIRTCRHFLATGHRCQGAAVRGRSCCRHHLETQTRLHNMARARRQVCVPRLQVPITPDDLARNRAEILRVIATGNFDFATARMLLWTIDLSAAGLCAEYDPRLRQTRILAAKPNRIYQVPVNPFLERSYPLNLSEVLENTRRKEDGVHCQAGLSCAPPRSTPATGRRNIIAQRSNAGRFSIQS